MRVSLEDHKQHNEQVPVQYWWSLHVVQRIHLIVHRVTVLTDPGKHSVSTASLPHSHAGMPKLLVDMQAVP